MTIPNPDHLLEQAERLIGARQADLRRAVSAAYYALFHPALAAAADQVVERGMHLSPQYRLVYRSINHGTLRTLCTAVANDPLPQRYRQYAEAAGFDQAIRAFAKAVVELQIAREEADYDPLKKFNRSDARAAIDLGRTAPQRFEAAPQNERSAFLSLLLFPPRS